MTEPLLQVEGISTYYGPLRALDGVSIKVPKGAIVAVLGANGAGKTTLLKSISGLLPPSSGTIRFDGRPVERVPAEKLSVMGMAHVPEGRQVFPELTVQENLLMGAYARKDRANVPSDLERVREYFPVLRERAGQPAGTLSGGEQQMLAIGRALMSRPRLLLLDEPSLGLSPVLVRQIFAIIKTINKAGTTIVMVEQNANMALRLADYAYILLTGRVGLEGEAARLAGNPEVRKLYLGH